MLFSILNGLHLQSKGFVNSVPVAQQLMQERLTAGIRQASSEVDLKRWGPRLVRSTSASVPVAANPASGFSNASESSYTTRSRRRQGEKLFPSDCDGKMKQMNHPLHWLTRACVGIPYYGITDDSDEEGDGFGSNDNFLLTPQSSKPKDTSLSYLASLNRPRSITGRFLSVCYSSLHYTFIFFNQELFVERGVDQARDVENGRGRRHKWHNSGQQSWRLKQACLMRNPVNRIKSECRLLSLQTYNFPLIFMLSSMYFEKYCVDRRLLDLLEMNNRWSEQIQDGAQCC